MSVLLVTVAVGAPYERYAQQLSDSAEEYFKPTDDVGFLCLDGVAGWPDATLYRYHVLLQNDLLLLGFDHVFLVDADMLFVAPVGDEVLGDLVATEHPGYVGMTGVARPYERGAHSAAFVPTREGDRYFCGGFVGGRLGPFLDLARRITHSIDRDDALGVVARWHDESHLNRQLILTPPTVVLSPSYCYPEDDDYYLGFWPQPFEKKLLALEKTAAERGVR